MVVCLSANGGSAYTDQAPPRKSLVGTVDGVTALERTARDAPWQVARHSLGGSHISALLYEPRRGGLFAGVHGKGLYASMDGGDTWELRTRGLTHEHVWSLACVERDGAVTLYAGTEPAYVFQSTDYGENWEELPALRTVPGRERWLFPPPPHIAHVKSIASDPRDTRTLYVGVEQGALLKSTDAGRSWQEFDDYASPDDVFYKDVHRLAVCPSDPRRIYMSNGDGLYVSADGGETWEHLTSLRSVRIGYPDAFVLSPLDDRVLFVGGAAGDPSTWQQPETAHFDLVRSRDGGRTWESLAPRLPRPLRANIEAMSQQAWPGGFSVFAGTAVGEIFASDDQGESWALIAAELAPVSQSTHYRRFLPPDSSQQAQQPVGAR